VFLTSVRLLIISAILLLTSCALFPPPTSQERSRADYGNYPDNYKNIVTAYASKILPEPFSAQYTYVRGPAKTWVFKHTHYQYGWGVCYIINGKDIYGNAGNRYFFALINNGSVIEYEYDDDPNSLEYARYLCALLKQ
jgi:hypothetical protein